MIGAQLRDGRELPQRDVLTEVLFDIIGNLLFLPTCEAASQNRSVRITSMQSDQLMGENETERLRMPG